MANYNDQYRGSQPPRRPRYYDDDDSDYDEHTGTRYAAGSGRGWGDDNASAYMYNDRASSRSGPARPYNEREDSYRSEREREREGTVVERRERRQDDERSYVSRRERDGGRDRERERDRSESRSRSRSRDGFKEKLEGAFDTSGRGLGVGIAGALAGALAGRQIGKGKHAERDMIIGALVGGLGANAAEQGFRTHKERRERDGRRDEDRIEQRWDGRRDDDGRSGSRGR